MILIDNDYKKYMSQIGKKKCAILDKESYFSKIQFSKCKLKALSGLELMICSSQSPHFNHWVMMIFNQIDW